MPRDVSVEKAHHMCDLLENAIREKLPNSSVTIHVEPCNENDCAHCEISVCDLRKIEDSESTD
jgi:divalent metal cation (Fe/Co/Zn/Cd) transporter